MRSQQKRYGTMITVEQPQWFSVALVILVCSHKTEFKTWLIPNCDSKLEERRRAHFFLIRKAKGYNEKQTSRNFIFVPLCRRILMILKVLLLLSPEWKM